LSSAAAAPVDALFANQRSIACCLSRSSWKVLNCGIDGSILEVKAFLLLVVEDVFKLQTF